MLKIDRGQRCLQLPHIARRRTGEAAKLAIAPMRRCHRLTPARNEQGKALGIVTGGFHADLGTFNGSNTGAICSDADRAMKIGERQVALIVGAREPFGRDVADAFTAEISTLKPDDTGRGLEIMVLMLKSPETKKPG
ncbi:hypothetical protein GGE07_002923 [Sinorhizobium terangae]|nr:hypothetical protein [Sinorhizobium terangae]